MSDIATPTAIGRNVKKERQERKLSLDELAAASGVSKATLSQIESGKVNPTVATLWKIAQSMQVDFNALIRGEGERIRAFQVSRSDDLTRLDTDNEGVHIKVLSPIALAEELELYLLTFRPGAVLASQAHATDTTEVLTVLAGEVRVTAGRNSVRLGAGDVLLYQCDIEHRIENISGGESLLHMVVKFKR